MFTLADYVGPHSKSPDWTDGRKANARRLMLSCANLQARMMADGIQFHINPATGTTISGQGNGGFREQNCPIGASDSAHKQGLAVDRYDPYNELDGWLMDNQDALVEFGIYIEHPDSTPHWSHWSIRAPESNHHVFYP